MTDPLARLEALLKAATGVEPGETDTDVIRRGRAIVALVNAAPAMIAEIRAGREMNVFASSEHALDERLYFQCQSAYDAACAATDAVVGGEGK